MQPDASLPVLRELRGLIDDARLRAWLEDEFGIDSGGASRILRAERDDGQATRPTVGLLEAVLQRALEDRDANGRRSRIEALLSALVGGRAVRLATAGPAVPLSVTPTQVLDAAAAGAMPLATVIDRVRRAVADGRIDTSELRDIRQAAAALKAAVCLVEQTAEAAARQAGRESNHLRRR